MKFRKNVKEEKLFRGVAIGGLVLLAVQFIIFLITRANPLSKPRAILFETK